MKIHFVLLSNRYKLIYDSGKGILQSSNTVLDLQVLNVTKFEKLDF